MSNYQLLHVITSTQLSVLEMKNDEQRTFVLFSLIQLIAYSYLKKILNKRPILHALYIPQLKVVMVNITCT